MLLYATHSYFLSTLPISRLQHFPKFMDPYLGRCSRLLHFAPLALWIGSFHTVNHESSFTTAVENRTTAPVNLSQSNSIFIRVSEAAVLMRSLRVASSIISVALCVCVRLS